MTCKCVCKNECVCPPYPGTKGADGKTIPTPEEEKKQSLMDKLKGKLDDIKSDPRLAGATGFLGSSALYFYAGGSKKWYILGILILIILICSLLIYWFYIRTPSEAEMKLMNVTSSIGSSIGGLSSKLPSSLTSKLPSGLLSKIPKL